MKNHYGRNEEVTLESYQALVDIKEFVDTSLTDGDNMSLREFKEILMDILASNGVRYEEI